MTTKTPPRYEMGLRSLEIPDYPLGGSRRGAARYWVESGKRGERIARQTESRPGAWFNPKRGTYGRKCAILKGDDGRIYCAQLTNDFDMIYVMNAAIKINTDVIFAGSEPDRFKRVRQLIESAE